MINSILQVILQVFIWLCSFIVQVAIAPLLNFVTSFFPDLSSYISVFYTFYQTYIINGLQFALKVFYNITGYPFGLFQILVTFWLAKISIYVFLKPIAFIYNMWHLIRSGDSTSSSKTS